VVLHGSANAVTTVAAWPARRFAVAVPVAAVFAVATGIPTDVVPTELYRRMTPVVWWNYPLWAASAVLTGLVAATYMKTRERARAAGARLFGGGVLSFLAIGCPACNKLVVALLGVGGATAYFGPAQPLLGVAGVLLLAVALWARLQGEAACAAAPRPSRLLRRPV
jgi:hypothetical protein